MLYLEFLIPAILTVIGNIIFYLIIKKRVDKSITKYSIIYSGIFTERLKIYRILLEKIFDLKLSIEEQINSSRKDVTNITENFNEFMKSSKINAPLLSDKMNKNLEKLKLEFSDLTKEVKGINRTKTNNEDAHFTLLSKNVIIETELLERMNNGIMIEVEDNLVSDMKKDFSLEYFDDRKKGK